MASKGVFMNPDSLNCLFKNSSITTWVEIFQIVT